VALSGETRRDDDLGTLERLDQGRRFLQPALGSVGEWLFRHVAGIELDRELPGFQRFVLRPIIGPGLDFARASYQTLHGEIRSEWKRRGDQLTWRIRVPANTSARVHIPSDADTAVATDGLSPVAREGRALVCDATAGTYELHSTFGN
jgi:alpha-L-rhamnosidase